MLAVFSDLDGSLRAAEVGIPEANLRALEHLGQEGIVRILATGRSLYAAQQVLQSDFPIDYLIFSSGAGILDWRREQLLCRHDLEHESVTQVLQCLQAAGLDFMLHASVPENHYFFYQRHSGDNPDFEQRLQLYAQFAHPLTEWGETESCSACLAIVPANRTESLYAQLQRALPQLSVIRATSPLDHCSGWLEIFPAQVSKSQAAAWLAQRLQFSQYMAFGNDYNDLDLLHWAQAAYVVADAPDVLLQAFTVVASAASGGFAEAVQHWLSEMD